MESIHPPPIEEKASPAEDKTLQAQRFRRLDCLPNEVLILIVDAACAEAEKSFGRGKMDGLIVQLSLVSHNFRYATLKTIRLWTRIDNRYCLAGGFEERLARTAGMPLTIHVDLSRRRKETERKEVLRQVTTLKDRLQYLHARIEGTFLNVSKKFPQIDIPQLQYARLQFDDEYTAKAVFKNWGFQNIETLDLVGAIPPAVHYPRLTSFRWKYGFDNVHVSLEDDYPALIAFLNHTPMLESLSLDLSTLKFMDATDPTDPLQANLPHLTTLFLSNHADFENYGGYVPSTEHPCFILTSLKMPQLRDFRLCLCIYSVLHLDYLTEAAESFLAVTSLSIISPLPFVDAYYMRHILTLFPNVQKLGLDFPDVLATMLSLDRRMNLNQLRLLVLSEKERVHDRDEVAGTLHNLTTSVDDLRIEWKDPVCSGFLIGDIEHPGVPDSSQPYL